MEYLAVSKGWWVCAELSSEVLGPDSRHPPSSLKVPLHAANLPGLQTGWFGDTHINLFPPGNADAASTAAWGHSVRTGLSIGAVKPYREVLLLTEVHFCLEPEVEGEPIRAERAAAELIL